MSTQTESYTHLHLRQHWPAWLLFDLICALSAISLVFLALSWATPVPDTYGFRGAAMLLALTFGSIGLLLARRHPQNPIGWLLLLAGLINSILEFCVEYATYALLTKPGELPYGTLAAWIASWIWVAAIGTLIYSFLLFPTGHLPSARWRPVAWFFVGAFGLMTFVFMIRSGPLYFAPYLDNPFAVQVAYRVLSPMPVGIAAAVLLVGISVILRLRRAEGVERQQLKWFAYAVTLRAIIGISESLAEAVGLKGTGPKFYQYLSVAIWIAIAVAIAFAIMRYRLWDIDIIINRTLVYGALTASVVGLYVLIVGGLGTVLQTQNNLPVIVIAILLIAFCFQPLRRRLQDIVNRFVPVPQAIINPSIDAPAPQTQPEQKVALTDSAHTAWFVCAILAAIILIGAVPVYYSHYVESIIRNFYGLGQFNVPLQTLIGLGDLINSFISFALALLLFWRKSHARMAFLASWVFLIGAVAWNDTLDYFLTTYIGVPPTRDLYLPFQIPWMILLFCIFPNGRFVPGWTRWLFLVSILISLSSLALAEWRSISAFTVFPQFILVVYAQFFRYRRVSSDTERQQTKWVIFGLLVTIVLSVIASLIDKKPSGPLLNLIPLTLAIAILRYRLWDIDIIMNRALVYGALTTGIVALYILIVGTLSLLSQTIGNLVISLLATGLIAFLFQPLRERLQRGVNRLVYGERDDPYTVLSRLGQRLEAAYAPESVLPTIVETVAQTLKLPYVAIALNQGGEFKIAAKFGRSKSEPVNLPLTYQGEPVGELILAPRAPGEHFTGSERQLLDDLARQAGVAAHAVRLTGDLQQSRERLVLAREEERRRLRRDLHDDLAPTLASLGLTASTAADLISTNPTTATKLVKELQTEIRATVGNIRRLVYDLRPPTLDELGLLAAIRERATQYSNAPDEFHVTVDEPGELPTLPAAVEVAAYRIVQEALENVSKHSQARACSIRFANHNGLEIEITDDGIGLPLNITPGVGLRSMRERAEELGGTCMIERGKNGGTRVLACLPIGEFDGTLARPHRG